MRKFLLFCVLFTLAFIGNAQVTDDGMARQLVTQNADAIGLSKDGLNNYIVSSSYFNNAGGTQMVYLNQSYKGIPVYNQMLVLAFKEGKLISKAGSFLTDAGKLVNTNTATPVTAPAEAVRTSIAEAKVDMPAFVMVLNTLENGKKYDFGKLDIANENIIAELMWVPVDDGKSITALKLAWQVQLYLSKKADYWNIRVDATTNKVIDKNNLTVYENFDQIKREERYNNLYSASIENVKVNQGSVDFLNNPEIILSPSLVGTANYTVIPYPAESPIHPGGTAAVRTNPWTLAGGNAVSLGWHNDGATDYTTSRGNNVHAHEDQANNNSNNGIMAVSTTTPDPLNFTYPINYNVAPTTVDFQQFAITNLFYWNNICHDLTYNYGFTEPAGNFQNNNQGRGGAQTDYVQADAQDGGGTNNANFATPADGAKPRMQMYLWSPARGVTTMTVNTPATIAGPYNAVEGAMSTANLLANVGPVTAQVIYYNDPGTTHEACAAPANTITGKIALINRGTCTFAIKVKNAQDAGAVAVIMVNNVPGAPIIMGGTDNTITIPAVMISDVDGATIAAQLANNVNVTLSGTPGGSVQLDGDIDNGIITHEFFHGVSNRLTGGPSNSGCLGNAEEGGEGWSDYMALMSTTDWSTALITDGNTKPRPMGNYAFGYPVTGPGIRLYPYCTNIAVNPLTYANMGVAPVGTEVHNIGEIWCMALWEMTWSIIQTDGINPNFFNAAGTGGNTVAFKLVMEGMKLQPCSPGYIDARNAILQADVNLYGGVHTCAIWNAFAKRGMGFSASQGSANSATDQTPAFDLPPSCIVAAPSVTINQAAAQADPTSTSPINFTVVFDQVVTGFTTGDVTLTGTAGATTGIVTGSGTTYNVAVSGMTSSGTVIATIAAGVCTNGSAQANNASTSTDNTVTYNLPAGPPNVTINQAAAQADPTSTSPINFTVVFDQVVTGFATGDVTLSGTAGATTGTVTGSGTTYNVAVSGMTSSGTVIATIAAGVCTNGSAQANNASTSTDNTVTYNLPAAPPNVTINQAAAQADPTSISPINFTVVFDQVVTGFATGDVTLTGTAGATTGIVTGSGTTYNVAVSGMTISGTVIATIAAGVCTNGSAQANNASTSTDNTVTFNFLAPVTVTATAGTPGPTSYNTVKLAFDAINAGTHQGNIIVNINGNTDEGATPAVLNSSGTGSSSYASILVRPTVDGLSVVGSATPASRGVIELNGADNVTIDGDNPNTAGTNRNLSITLTTTNAAVVIWLKTVSAADGCLNNSIKNCNLTGQNTYNSIAGVIAGSGTFGGAAQTGNNNNTLQNNAIKRVQNGLYQSGYATSPYDVNWQIKDNTFGSSVLADKLGFRGMILLNNSAYFINNNSITGVNSSAGTSSTMTGIQLGSGNLNGTISNNKISDIKHNNPVGWGANGMYLAATTTASNTNIFNNFISDVAGAGFTGRTVSDNGYGIAITAGGGYNVYYNSVWMNTNQVNDGYPAALLVNTVSTNNTLNIRDNLFINTQTVGSQHYCVQSAATAARYLDINYNDYYTSGPNLGYLGSNRVDLAAWQTATGKDANSISVPVQFVSTSDLHLIPGNCLVDGKGTPITIPAITTDIDADTRNAVTPDMGADEFAVASTPTVNQPPNQAVCTGTLTAPVNFTGTATAYTWTNNAPSIGLAASGTGNIAAFTALNITNGPIVATITVTPTNGTCTGTPVSFTITVNENPNLLVIADPGTTLCEGDPTLLTVYNAAGSGPVALTQSTSQVPVAGSVSCNAGGLHTDNSYWRAYDLAPLGLPSALTVTNVTFGVEQASGGPQPVTVRLYTQNAGPAFPGGTRTLIGTQTASLPNQALSLFTVTFGTPVVVPSNAVLIVELFTPNGQASGYSFFIGSNPAAQTGTSYLSAPDCAVTNPTDVAAIGFPNMHIILNVNGTVAGTGGIATGTFLWSPAAGLSSITSNPVAASPMNTTTYTVTRTTVPGGCIASANITITVNKRPTVTVQPVSQVNCSGTTATFTVGGTGTGLTYQWQQSVTGVGGPWTNLTNIAPYGGATGPVLTINPVSGVMNGYAYRCVLSGTCAAIGTANISNAVLLTVNPLPNVSITPPVSCGGVAGIYGTQLSVNSSAPPIPGNVSASSGAISVVIPDGTGVAAISTLNIAGVPANATITQVKITMNMNHTWVGDVDVNIKSPNAAILNLVGGLDGGTGGNSSDNFTNTAFSSLGGATISGAAAPRTGTYAAEARVGYGPTGYIQAAPATWGGLTPTATSANGVWTLAMGDWAGGDQGTLTSWSISIDYTTPGSGGGPTLTYVWSPLAGLYNNSTATVAYTGTNTPTVYAAPTAQTVYTVTATDVATGCVGTATALVNYTPPAPTITPSSVTMCLGDPAVMLKSSSSQAYSATFNSGAMSLAIPDGPATWPQTLFPGVSTPNLPVSGIPANATITGMSVKLNLTHTYIADMVIVLKAPNGAVLNLDANISRTGGAGANFVNTIISSASSTALSAGAPPYTGTFKPDAVGATYTAVGFTFPGGPTTPAGYIPTVSSFSGLYSVPNGNWTLGIYDWGAGDLGTLTNWELKIDYIIGVPATPAVWTPAAGLYSNASATTPYVAGTAVDSVWTRPTPSGVYNYQATVQNIITNNSTIATPMAGGNGNNLVAFNVRNNNATPINFNSISSNTFGSGAVVSRVFYKAAPIAGNPGPISAANGWIQFGTANNTVTAGSLNLLMSGLTLSIPAGATYGIALDMTGATFPAYTNGTGTIQTYSNNNVDLITDGNVGWGGPAAPGTPANNPRNFNGSIDLGGSGPGTCTSPARTVVVTVKDPTTVVTQPVNQTICTDKVATFTVAGGGSGPFSYQWQVSTNGGNPPWTNVANGGVYSGATSATLTITAPPVSMSGYQYRCVITGAAPCAAATSFSRILTVNPLPVVVISASPYTSLLPGLVTTLSSTVSPNAAASYSWLHDGASVPGANTGSLSVDVDGLGDYQLSVIDVNGCTSSSNIIKIKDSASGKCFIYPNPTNGQFQVRYYSVANNVLPRSLTVYDAKGDRAFTKFYTIGRPYDRMDVDMRAYGKGLYWVEIGDLNGNRITMCRVVIQ